MFCFRLAGFFAILLLAAGPAIAGGPTDKPFDISTPASFHAQADRVREGMQPGGAYAFLSAQQRAQVEQRIADIDALFKRFGSLQAMGGAERVDMFNAQEAANQILTRGRTGNIRCAWTPKTGTHIARSVCWKTEG